MGRPKITIEELEKRIKERFPEESFEIIEYDSLGQPGSLRCLNCDTIISVSKMSNFFIHTKAHGCVNCKGLWIKREQEKEKILERYDILEEYVKDTHTYYIAKCKKCGHVRDAAFSAYVRFLECGCVTGVKRNRSKEEFINTANQHSRIGKYELIGDYINQTTKVKLRHLDCGFIWSVRPSDMIHGRSGCPRCMKSFSKRVLDICKKLKEYKIPFVQEQPLENSRQRFDFWFPEINTAIEYNGEQHYVDTNFFCTTLEQQQERDERKRQYCKERNIELIEIPYFYTDEQIDEIIVQIVNKFNDYLEREQSQVARNDVTPEGV